jgi:hypothetical protein
MESLIPQSQVWHLGIKHHSMAACEEIGERCWFSKSTLPGTERGALGTELI